MRGHQKLGTPANGLPTWHQLHVPTHDLFQGRDGHTERSAGWSVVAIPTHGEEKVDDGLSEREGSAAVQHCNTHQRSEQQSGIDALCTSELSQPPAVWVSVSIPSITMSPVGIPLLDDFSKGHPPTPRNRLQSFFLLKLVLGV